MRRVALFFAPLLFALFVVLPMGGTAGAATAVFPTVSGGFGTTPKISFPNVSAPKSLESKVLVSGNGTQVKKGSLLVANYVGQIWRGKVFDSSFSRNELAPFPIGVNQVIKGWDETLVGRPVGARLLLVVPPADGYGAKGNTGAGITGTDTLVFVVDIVGSYPTSVTGDLHATDVKTNVNGISVNGALGKPPTILISNKAPLPGKLTAAVLAKGHGNKVKAGLVVLQYVVADWTNKVLQSTWKTGTPDGELVGNAQQPSALDPLVGVPVGSRVLLEIPKSSSGGPFALAIDIVAQPTSAATKASSTK